LHYEDILNSISPRQIFSFKIHLVFCPPATASYIYTIPTGSRVEACYVYFRVFYLTHVLNCSLTDLEDESRRLRLKCDGARAEM
jgi:hypothetical protein